jgi:hypothetical protein
MLLMGKCCLPEISFISHQLLNRLHGHYAVLVFCSTPSHNIRCYYSLGVYYGKEGVLIFILYSLSVYILPNNLFVYCRAGLVRCAVRLLEE